MSSDTATIVHLSLILQDFTWYTIIIITSFGLFGNLLNFLIFISLKLFRSNPQAFYLRAGAIVDSLFLLFMFCSRYSSIIYGYDPGKTSLIWCKLRTGLGQSGRLISSSIVCFAAFDQFLATNYQYRFRRLSTLNLARLLLVVSTILCLAHGIPPGIYYNIDSTSNCVVTRAELIHYYAYFYYPVLHGFLPIFLSAFFSLLAYRNVRRLVRLQTALNRRRLDRQLTAMIFARVLCFIIFLLPYTIYRIYLLNSEVPPMISMYRYLVLQLIENVILCWLSINYGISFYLFAATSSRYRRQIKIFLTKKCWKPFRYCCSTRRPVRVIPSGAQSTTSVSE